MNWQRLDDGVAILGAIDDRLGAMVRERAQSSWRWEAWFRTDTRSPTEWTAEGPARDERTARDRAAHALAKLERLAK